MKKLLSLHQSVYFALGILIMKSVSLLMLPIVTHYLSPAQFGEIELLISISDFATILVGFGMAEALYRFAGLAEDDQKACTIGGTIFSVTMITGCIGMLVGLLIAPWLQQSLGGGITLWDVQLLVFLFAVDGMLVIPLSWLKLRENAIVFFLLTTSKAICMAFVTWIYLRQGYGITSILLGGAISSALLVSVLFVMQYRQTGIRMESV